MTIETLPLEVWPQGITQASPIANDNALRVEAMERGALGFENDETTSEPADGDCYVVDSSPTGAFASFAPDDVVIYRDGTWYGFSPFNGLIKAIAGDLYIWGPDSSTGWQLYAGGGGSGSGDVVGPASSVTNRIAVFADTTGKEIADGGATIAEVRAIPQNSQSTAYTLVLADAGKHILHPSSDTTARTFTIPANASVAFPIGTAVTFINQDAAGVVTIAITSDTMRLAGAGTTGSRTLAANGVATAIKLTATEWIVSGVGLT